jgi:hypothetical protein
MEKAQSTETEEQTSRKEPTLEVPITPEQHAILRAWLEANDFIEVVSGPGNERLTLINARELNRRNHPGMKQEVGGEMIDFRISLFSP